MDCLVLAGDRKNYVKVANRKNKAFLDIGGRTILRVILEELQDVEEIDRFVVVGPLDALQAEVDAIGADLRKDVQLIEQENDLVSNILIGVHATAYGKPLDRHYLVMSSDIPLITAEEVRQFIQLSDMSLYDYVGGVTTEKAIQRFAPSDDESGVRMALFQGKEGRFRINNLHMVRPSAVRYMEYIRRTYAVRYQKQFLNMIRMAGGLFGALMRAPGSAPLFMGFQMAAFCDNRDWKRLAAFVRKGNSCERAARYISKILGTRFKIAVTSYGGAAVDVDNDEDYAIISQRHSEWLAMQKRLGESEPGFLM